MALKNSHYRQLQYNQKRVWRRSVSSGDTGDEGAEVVVAVWRWRAAATTSSDLISASAAVHNGYIVQVLL